MPTLIVSLVITAILAYLWGSLPAGYWMGKLLRGRKFDIRQHGSHKIGAANVQRILGTIPGLIVLFFDISKGVVSALLATFVPFFYGGGWGILVAGLAALLGHCFPIFIGFRGGRGVMTEGGILLVISPLIFVISLITGLTAIGISRYISLGSLLAGLIGLVFGIAFYVIGLAHPDFFAPISLPQMLYMVIAPTFVAILHADNIARLLKGTERKIGKKISTESEPSTPESRHVDAVVEAE
ncbi:MAG TPA: glycerol-3-phosphate 1-O-acyltransferase PlsY [Ktedonobacteraceae bacterium]|nr:glycerol-3-phosphate 1-O-acyltransferase PlsY [Ktedonobacteraceae bacterium]